MNNLKIDHIVAVLTYKIDFRPTTFLEIRRYVISRNYGKNLNSLKRINILPLYEPNNMLSK